MEASAKFGFFRGEGEEQIEKGVMVVEKEKHASDSSLSPSLSFFRWPKFYCRPGQKYVFKSRID